MTKEAATSTSLCRETGRRATGQSNALTRGESYLCCTRYMESFSPAKHAFPRCITTIAFIYIRQNALEPLCMQVVHSHQDYQPTSTNASNRTFAHELTIVIQANHRILHHHFSPPVPLEPPSAAPSHHPPSRPKSPHSPSPWPYSPDWAPDSACSTS